MADAVVTSVLALLLLLLLLSPCVKVYIQ